MFSRLLKIGMPPALGLLFLTGCGGKTESSPAPAADARSAQAGGVDPLAGGSTDALLQKVATLHGRAEVRIDFSRSAVTDDDLARLEMPDSIVGIDLSHTQATDQGMTHLLRARNLESINLVRTGVTAAGVETLKQLPSLHEVKIDDGRLSMEEHHALLRFLAPRASARAQRKLTAQRSQ